MAITISGTIITVTGGTSTVPVTFADIAAALPANLVNSGNYWKFVGVTRVNFGDQGTTPTYFSAVNAIIDADRVCEFRVQGKNAIPTDTTVKFGEVDLTTSKGINGCIFTSNIRVLGVGGEIHFYASTVYSYTANFYYAFLYATDNKFTVCGDRIGRVYLWRRNTVQSSDRLGGITAIPGFSAMFDTAPTGNTRIFADTDDVLFVVTTKAEGETLYINKNAKISWAYSGAKAINYGKFPQNVPSQVTAYNDSVFETYAVPVWRLRDVNGNNVSFTSATLTDNAGTTYTTAAGTDNPNGLLKFANVLLQRWTDRPGGQVGVTNYTDFSPHILQVVDSAGNTYTLEVDLSTRWNEGEERVLVLPVIQAAPQVAHIVLAETIWSSAEKHEVYYTDNSGLNVTCSLEFYDATNTLTLVTSGNMTEIQNGLYRYIMDLSALTLPNVPGYYIIRADTGQNFDARSIEIVTNAGGGSTPQAMANAVWTDGRALTLTKFLGLKNV